jgi:hypothetical protein
MNNYKHRAGAKRVLELEAAAVARLHEKVKSDLALARDMGIIGEPELRPLIERLKHAEARWAAARYELAVQLSDFEA